MGSDQEDLCAVHGPAHRDGADGEIGSGVAGNGSNSRVMAFHTMKHDQGNAPVVPWKVQVSETHDACPDAPLELLATLGREAGEIFNEAERPHARDPKATSLSALQSRPCIEFRALLNRLTFENDRNWCYAMSIASRPQKTFERHDVRDDWLPLMLRLDPDSCSQVQVKDPLWVWHQEHGMCRAVLDASDLIMCHPV